MDVAQITGSSSSPIRRDQDPLEADYDDYRKEDFSSYLDDTQESSDYRPEKIPPAESRKVAPAPDEQQLAATAAPEKQDGPEQPPETPDANAAVPADPKNGIKTATPATPEKAAVATTLVAGIAELPTPAQQVTPVVPAAAEPGKATAEAAKALQTPVGGNPEIITPAPTSEPAVKVAEAEAPAKLQAAVSKGEIVLPVPAQGKSKTDIPGTPTAKAELPTDKTTPVFSSENVTKALPPESLEKIRADANARLVEKDILSTKITELLHESKGKISLTPAATKSTFQSALASSTNLVSASMGENVMAAGSLNPQLGLVENPGGQTLPVAATDASAVVKDVMTTIVPTSSAAVHGVDSSAANAASQAANAMRAMGQTGVSEQVAMQINSAAKDGLDRIKISLNPSELGRVEVKMEIGHDGRVIAVIAVDKQETLDLLQRDARSLERALQEAGFETGSGSLNFGLSEQGQRESTDFADAERGVPDLLEEMPMEAVLPAEIASGTGTESNLDIQV